MLDPSRGSIKSITDKKTGREMVDTFAAHVFGQYLYQQFDREECDAYVNLFNNKWNTNFRSFWQGNPIVRARLWAVDEYAAEKDLTTPVMDTLAPMLTGMCNYGKGNLPVTAQGLSLSRKGVLLATFATSTYK